jgi:hypothetical protein
VLVLVRTAMSGGKRHDCFVVSFCTIIPIVSIPIVMLSVVLKQLNAY